MNVAVPNLKLLNKFPCYVIIIVSFNYPVKSFLGLKQAFLAKLLTIDMISDLGNVGLRTVVLTL